MLLTFFSLVAFAYADKFETEPQILKPGMTIVESSPVMVSKPLRSLVPAQIDPTAPSAVRTFEDIQLISPKIRQVKTGGDPSIVQDRPIGNAMPTATANFDGVNNLSSIYPPDTQGDIGWDPVSGKKYYVQWVNLSYQMWDVTDPDAPVALLGSPAAGNTLWAGTGTLCASHNDGDPLTRFDAASKRWVMSQFALSFPNDFHQCIAVSQTADPTGAWFLYDFKTSSTVMNDYGKIGVWTDGYYMSFNQFSGVSPNPYAGAAVAVFERDKMLAGQAARMIYTNLGAKSMNYYSLLPSDLDGPAPAAGTPNYFMEWDDSSWLGDATDTLRVWEFKTDWVTPANTTFGLNSNYDPNLKIATANVDPDMCGGARNCIPQHSSAVKVDAITDRLMYRLQYRNFGTYQTIVGNHTVDATGADKAGVHWFELRNTGSGFAMHQEGVYAPADGENRWMASAAMDSSGNIALGYSVASSATDPSIRYTGRLAGDTAGTMPQGEQSLIAGTGAQTGSVGRWGDYSMMAVDPSDGCTFWYTQEYVATTGGTTWRTRIGSFKFPSCTSEVTGTLSGTVTNSSSTPIVAANIDINPGGITAVTDAAGHYSITLAAGTYTVSAAKYGYITSTVPGVTITAPGTTTQNFTLAAAPTYTISGSVTDSGTTWPLYARIDIAGSPGGPVFTNPSTGSYSVDLAAGSYTFTVTAMSGGYTAAVLPITVTTTATRNIGLAVNAVTCSAPGYKISLGVCSPIPSVGFVTGTVRDANTGAAISNPTVKDASLNSATMIDTTADPAHPAKMYIIAQPAGSTTLTATAPNYSPNTASPTVIAGTTIVQDISLAAGILSANPASLSFTVTPGDFSSSLPLSLINSGGAAATYEVFRVLGTFTGYAPTGPFADNTRHFGPMNLNDKDAKAMRVDLTPTDITPLAPRDVSGSWDTSLAFAWGIGFNTDATDLWLSNLGLAGGDDLDYRFTTAGVKTGDMIDTTTWMTPTGFAADMTYNPFTKTLWQVNVGGDNCIYELDPAAKISTGNKICPAFGTSERGLAFDPLTSTYYSGSWNDGIINHFAPNGTILDSKAVGLAISGLAFNPGTGHLFVMTNNNSTSDSSKYDVYVLDTNAAYANLGGFNLKSGGVKAFADYAQSGLEIDCAGNLWAVDQLAQKVYVAPSGETGVCDWNTTWLSVTPTTGSVIAGGAAPLTVSVDTTGLAFGTYKAYLNITNSTPYGASIVPVTLNVKSPIIINEGHERTSNPTVTLALDYKPAPATMQFLIDKGSKWTKLETFNSSKTIKLPAGNGIKTVSVRFVDAGGNPTRIYSSSIFLDAAAPVGTISINNGEAATDSKNLTLRISAFDSDSGQLKMRFSEDGKSWPLVWDNFSPTATYTLGTHPAVATVTPGVKKVYVQFTDDSGKLSKSYFDTISYVAAEVPPGTQSNITINGGADITDNGAVTLSLTAPGGEAFVRLSNDGTHWGKWQFRPFPTSWKLASGDGLKTVYAQFTNNTTSPSATTYSDSITLDTTAPAGWLLINNGAFVTGSSAVVLTMGAGDVNGVTQMCINETSACSVSAIFENFAPRKTYNILNTVDGKKTIYITFKDITGKVSKPVKASIMLDRTAPTGSIVINGGNPTTTSTTVTLKLKAAKAVYMQLSMNGGLPGEWEAYAAAKTVTLTGPPGTNTVSVQYRDYAGNVSSLYSDTIELL